MKYQIVSKKNLISLSRLRFPTLFLIHLKNNKNKFPYDGQDTRQKEELAF